MDDMKKVQRRGSHPSETNYVIATASGREVKISNLTHSCRFCLSHYNPNDKRIQLFSDHQDDEQIALKKLRNETNIDVDDIPGLSSSICKFCFISLQKVGSFTELQDKYRSNLDQQSAMVGDPQSSKNGSKLKLNFYRHDDVFEDAVQRAKTSKESALMENPHSRLSTSIYKLEQENISLRKVVGALDDELAIEKAENDRLSCFKKYITDVNATNSQSNLNYIGYHRYITRKSRVNCSCHNDRSRKCQCSTLAHEVEREVEKALTDRGKAEQSYAKCNALAKVYEDGLSRQTAKQLSYCLTLAECESESKRAEEGLEIVDVNVSKSAPNVSEKALSIISNMNSELDWKEGSEHDTYMGAKELIDKFGVQQSVKYLCEALAEKDRIAIAEKTMEKMLGNKVVEMEFVLKQKSQTPGQ